MTATMKRTAIMTALLLVGSVFVFAGTATANDVNECQSKTIFEPEYGHVHDVCVTDSQSGDESDCPDGYYEAETGVSVFLYQDVYADGDYQAIIVDGEWQGEESCSSWDPHREQEYGSVTVNQPNSGHSATVAHGWSQDNIYVFTDGDGDTLRLQWNDAGSDCQMYIEVNGETLVQEGCPAGGPPGAPNPGWGDVTPDTPE